MAPKTVTSALVSVLEELDKKDFEKFCFTIGDRREEPRVPRAKLEGKNRWEVVEILVKTFTESKALEVVLEMLGEIRCNEQKERLAEYLGGASVSTNYPSEAAVRRHADIMKVETTGASMNTAQQDKLKCSGVMASEFMAETDLVEMSNFKPIIKKVAHKKGVDPALIAAIISRSCRAGKTLKNGWGPDTFGLMQIYIDPSGDGRKPEGLWNSEEHLCQATDILIHFMLNIKHAFPEWTKEQQLKGGIAAYNAGPGNIHSYEEVDAKTSNGDYSNDVVARAQWYKREAAF